MCIVVLYLYLYSTLLHIYLTLCLHSCVISTVPHLQYWCNTVAILDQNHLQWSLSAVQCALYLQNTLCVWCVALFNLKYYLSCNTCNTDAKLMQYSGEAICNVSAWNALHLLWFCPLQWEKPQKNRCWFLLLIANSYDACNELLTQLIWTNFMGWY